MFAINVAEFARELFATTSFAKRTSLGEAVIICRRQTSFQRKKQSFDCFFLWLRGGDLKGPSENIVQIFAKAPLCSISPYFRDETQKNDTQSFFCVSPLTPGNSESSEVQAPALHRRRNQKKKPPDWVVFFWCVAPKKISPNF